MKKQRTAMFLFVLAAFLSLLVSVALWFTGYRDEGLFVGIWVPSILALGSMMLHLVPRGSSQ